LGRSVLEFGAEIDTGRWEEAEKLQRLVGRMVLGVGQDVADEVVLGELGWWTMQGRREYLRLAYWGNVVRGCGVGEGVVQGMYKEGRERIVRGEGGQGEWCVVTRDLLRKIGLGDRWETEEVGEAEEWKRVVKVMMHKYEEAAWRERMCSGGNGGRGKTKLCVYVRVKKDLCAEWFLRMDSQLVRRWVRLRAGVEELEVELGRRRGLRREERVCQCCSGGQVEEVGHFVGECSAWAGQREGMWDELSGVNDRWVRRVRVVRGWGRTDRVDWILRGGEGHQQERGIVVRCVIGMLYDRDKLKGVVKRERAIEGGNKRRQRKDKKRQRVALERVQEVGKEGRKMVEDRGGRKKKQKV
jgi:hypothetical protein